MKKASNITLEAFLFMLQSAAGFQIHRADKLVATPHHARYALVALTLPVLHRIGLVPRLVQLPILFGQAQSVLFAHIKICAGDHAANRRAGHDLLRLEVDLRQAGTVLTGLHRQPAVAEVAAVTVDLIIRLGPILTF